jgi:hypothetical protein
MASNDLKPWQVLARRPAPLAPLIESEAERLRTVRPQDASSPDDEREPRRPVTGGPATPQQD